MISSALAFLFLNWRALLLGGAGAGAMFLLWTVADVFDDAAVRREANAKWAAMMETEISKARAAASEQLLALERAKAEEMEKQRAEYEAALDAADHQIAEATTISEALQNEIAELEAARPDGVPTVRDLGVRLRNR